MMGSLNRGCVLLLPEPSTLPSAAFAIWVTAGLSSGDHERGQGSWKGILGHQAHCPKCQVSHGPHQLGNTIGNVSQA